MSSFEKEQREQKWLETRLRNAIQALASPIEVQLGLFAPFECPACELVLTFDDDYDPFIAFHPNLADPQRIKLDALAGAIDAMPDFVCEDSGPQSELIRSHWNEIRRLSADALTAMGWPLTPPPPMREVSPGVWSRGDGTEPLP